MAAIVANYGPRPSLAEPDLPLVEPVETTDPRQVEPGARRVEPAPLVEPVETNPFDRSYLDAVDAQVAENARARDPGPTRAISSRPSRPRSPARRRPVASPGSACSAPRR